MTHLVLIVGLLCPTLRITAYCDVGVTASGHWTRPGTCAAPAWVPFGSRVVVEGRTYIVRDRTHRRFRHNTVDIWLPSRAACREFGVRHSTVRVYYATPQRYHHEPQRRHRR